jgi:hypothetical protein
MVHLHFQLLFSASGNHPLDHRVDVVKGSPGVHLSGDCFCGRGAPVKRTITPPGTGTPWHPVFKLESQLLPLLGAELHCLGAGFKPA